MIGFEKWTAVRFIRAALQKIQIFKGKADGAIGILFALFFTVICAVSALAIDYARALAVKERLQHGVDAAILAASRLQIPADRTKFAEQFFNASFYDPSATLTSVTFMYDTQTRALTGIGRASLSHPFLAWSEAFSNVTARATATIVETVRALDLVFCIDATGSMKDTIDVVKVNALNFKNRIDSELLQIGAGTFDQFRIRVIYFRDYGGFGYRNDRSNTSISGVNLGDREPITASEFFTLPADNSAFVNFVSAGSIADGGDFHESGLECLNEAMDSDWTRTGSVLPDGRIVDETYPVIAIYTDTGAHPPNFTWSVRNPNYPPPSKMPRSYDGLLAKWNNPTIDQQNKMILFYGEYDAKRVDENYRFMSGWLTVKNWPGVSNPAKLTEANVRFISTLAIPLARLPQSRLSR